MNEKITICEKRSGSLYVLEEKTLKTQLDSEKMELWVKYKGRRYAVQGNAFMLYIVL